jgi:hypothetical protein
VFEEVQGVDHRAAHRDVEVAALPADRAVRVGQADRHPGVGGLGERTAERAVAHRQVRVAGVEQRPLGTAPPASRGNAPLPCRLEITPYGTRGRTDSISTLSTSPGPAPSTWIGPVTTCGPSTSKLRGVRS